MFYKYYDGGLWSNPVNVSETQGGAYYPCIAFGNDNVFHVAWHENYKVYYRQLKENQWSEKVLLSDTTMNCGSVKLCTDSENSVHFTWGSYGPNEDEWRIWYRKLENEILGESQLVYYDRTHHSSSYPDIAVFNNNMPAVAWEQVTQWGPLPVIEKIFYSKFDGAEWSEAETVSDSTRSSDPSISIDNNNIPCLAWSYTKEIPGEDHTYLLFSYKLNNNWIIPESPDNQLSYNSLLPRLKIDQSNKTHLVWQYGEPSPQFKGEIYYAKRDNISSINNINRNIPKAIILYPNYPNPFNQNTIIKYHLPEGSNINITIYNALGEKIKVINNGYENAGMHETVFDASNLSSGIYFYSISAGDFHKTKKMILLR